MPLKILPLFYIIKRFANPKKLLSRSPLGGTRATTRRHLPPSRASSASCLPLPSGAKARSEGQRGPCLAHPCSRREVSRRRQRWWLDSGESGAYGGGWLARSMVVAKMAPRVSPIGSPPVNLVGLRVARGGGGGRGASFGDRSLWMRRDGVGGVGVGVVDVGSQQGRASVARRRRGVRWRRVGVAARAGGEEAAGHGTGHGVGSARGRSAIAEASRCKKVRWWWRLAGCPVARVGGCGRMVDEALVQRCPLLAVKVGGWSNG